MTPVALRCLILVKSTARQASSWESLKCPGKCPRRARVTFNYLPVSVSSIYKNKWELPISFHSFLPLLDKWLWLDMKLASGGKNELGGHFKFILSKQKHPSFFPLKLCQPQMIRLKAKQLRNVDYHIGLDILSSKLTIFWDSEHSIGEGNVTPTPVLLPGKSHGWRSLVGCSPWGR